MNINPSLLTKMRLYHYTTFPIHKVVSSAKLYPGKFQGDDLKRAHSISFFFDAVPLDIIAGKFPDDHPTWKKGGTVYEHTVKVTDLAEPLSFEVVETPSLTKLADDNWGIITPEEYKKAEDKIHLKEGTRGTTRIALIRNILKFRGGTREAYKELFQRGDFKKDLSKYYAATVPHVLVWLPNDEVPVTKSEIRLVR